ncbi:MAG: tRNA (adenosine(37)-N6)-threonylcarbamoyltransferase complex dimerization subunit type 1 TsaB [Gammaproteobacteria bacterium]|nr:tRNA (adenosine(37)-N6)-threonylcarbamoyltransferase complex dimerization subunit type 1 TsaB [Gammaproteobacteria bacterium]
MAKRMNLVAIETSTSHASVALLFQGKLFVEEEVNFREHARVLLLMIDKLLKAVGIGFNQLDGIIFGEGPGSFTGLRIACSVAKGLAYAHDLPIFSVSGLQAIAYEVRQFNLPVLAMIDARMNQVYWAFEPKLGGDVRVSSPEDVFVPLGEPFILAGASLKPYIDALPQSVRSEMVSQHEVFPKACAMIDLVKAGGISSVTAEKAMPVYIRDQVTGGVRG